MTVSVFPGLADDLDEDVLRLDEEGRQAGQCDAELVVVQLELVFLPAEQDECFERAFETGFTLGPGEVVDGGPWRQYASGRPPLPEKQPSMEARQQ